MLFEEIPSSSNGVGIFFQGIAPGTGFLRGFGQLGVDEGVLAVLAGRGLVALRKS